MLKVFQFILLKVGERIALILVVIASFFLIYSETASKAYSNEQSVSFQRADLNWYEKNIDFQITPAKESISYSLTTARITPSLTPPPVQIKIINANEDIWDTLANCESKGNWSINTGNGYYGGLQFSENAWKSVGGSGLPHEHSRDEQILRGKLLQEKRGWGVWGACAKRLGLN